MTEEIMCPRCEYRGFNGQGHVAVDGKRMYLRQCMNCGLQFAAED